MAHILILYASTTGNTEMMAEAIADKLIAEGHEVVIKTFDFDWIKVAEIVEYDGIFVGTHTWDDGDLPYEVEDFYEELEEVDITNKVFAVFGSADSFYPTYGGAIDLIGNRLEDLGAHVYPVRLKVDMRPDKKDIQQCQQFANEVSQTISIENKQKSF